jgi:hypothetical protein
MNHLSATVQDQMLQCVGMLGHEAKDKVTGFTGMVSSIAFDAYGCIQAVLTPKVGKDAKYPDGHWFDVNRLEVGKRILPMPTFDQATARITSKGPAEKPLPR